MSKATRFARNLLRPNASSSSASLRQKALPPLPVQPRCQCRTFLTRRGTSFWSHSYPSTASTSQIPYTPPPPTSGARRDVIHAQDEHEATDGKDRKQRYLDSLMDKAGELSLRCSILDVEGNWTAEEGLYKKSELCRQYDLDPRDLRKLDAVTPNLVPIIITRRTCILISILNIRALIKPDRVIIFDTAGTRESEVTRKLKYHLERNIRAGLDYKFEEGGEEEIVLSYEHRALESILVATANALEEEMAFTRQLVQQLMVDLEDDINRDNLKRMLHYSKRLAGFQSRARYVKRAADEILESDEDLSAMYLTSRAQGRPRALHDHEQLELLLESFAKQVEEIVSEVDTTVANMNSTQEVAELMLDSGRNALLAMDIKISIATLGVGTGALVAGLFGMNLTTQLEQSPYAFLAVSGAAGAIALFICFLGAKVLRRVRRVALSGPRSRDGIANIVNARRWNSSVAQFSQGFDPALVDKGAEMAKRALWERIFLRKVQLKNVKAAQELRTEQAWPLSRFGRDHATHSEGQSHDYGLGGGYWQPGLEHGTWKWGKGYGHSRRWAKD